MKAAEDDNKLQKQLERFTGSSARLDGSDATGQALILNNEESVLIFFYPERLNTRVQSGRGSGDVNGRSANASWTRANVAVLAISRDTVYENCMQNTHKR